MKTLPISILHALFSYDPVTGLLRRKSSVGSAAAGSVVGTLSDYGYLTTGIDKSYYKVHRIVWAMYYGVWPEFDIDHKNGIKNDNKIDNLRDATKVINLQNQSATGRANNVSGRLGVRNLGEKYKSKPWTATINANRKRVFLGTFSTYEEACAAREAAETLYYIDHPKRTS